MVPDLIIMDVLMPGRDGIDACREIIDALEDVRVLMLTASHREGRRHRGGGRRRGRIPSEVHRDGAAVGHGQGRSRRRIPDAAGRDETRVQAAAPHAEGERFAKAEGADIEGRRRYSHCTRRGCRTPPSPSPGATAPRRSATPSPTYRTSWDSAAEQEIVVWAVRNGLVDRELG